MKLKIGELLEKKSTLDKVMVKDMPLKTSYRLGKIASVLMAEYKHIEKTRGAMFEKYGEKTEDGKNMKIADDKVLEFTKEWESFCEEEIELNIEKIPMECLETVEMNAYNVALLMDFIEAKGD